MKNECAWRWSNLCTTAERGADGVRRIPLYDRCIPRDVSWPCMTSTSLSKTCHFQRLGFSAVTVTSRRRTRGRLAILGICAGTVPSFPARKSAIIKLTHLFLQRPAFWPSSLILDMNGEAKTASTKHSSPDHSSSLGDSVTSSTRIRFSVRTPRRKSRSAVSISPATKSSGTPSIAAS